MKKIVLISGFKYSGKDTFSNFLVESLRELDEKAKVSHLAHHLKKVCSDVFKFDYDLVVNPLKKDVVLEKMIALNKDHCSEILDQFNCSDKTNIDRHLGVEFSTPRQILQYIGTEFLRDLSPRIHSEILDGKIGTDIEIISDHRFLNEAEYFKRYNHITYFVERKEKTPIYSEDLHSSEKEMFQIKKMVYSINNDSSLEDLRAKSRVIAKYLKEKFNERK